MKRFLIALCAALWSGLCAAGQTLTIAPLQNPAPAGSIEPNLSVGPDGSAILCWVEPAKDGSGALRYAVRSRGAAWSETRTVADHRRFFRHPAEVPEVITTAGGRWLAHWVEMPNPRSEAEYVFVSSSADGVHWTAPVQAHRDKSPVQHGLVSMTGEANGGGSLFFLQSLSGEDGPTFLMRSVIDASGKPVTEERLDEDVCSCCPTAVARTGKGIVLAYRDHTAKDVRDIAVTRFENGKWSAPKIVNADNWQINACPINAAAVAANGERVVVAWYTAAQNSPRVLAAISTDSGATFGKPATMSTGRAHGYASAAIDESGNAIVSWVEQGTTARVAARAISGAGAPGPVVEIAKGDRAALGYPKLARAGKETFIAWGGAKVQTASIH